MILLRTRCSMHSMCCCQFGFRKNPSTSLALIQLINKISSAIDRHEIPAGVFLDLSKAFDTLDHEILFVKLEHYGICDVALRWIKSYFSCRQQFVQFNEVHHKYSCSSAISTSQGKENKRRLQTLSIDNAWSNTTIFDLQ